MAKKLSDAQEKALLTIYSMGGKASASKWTFGLTTANALKRDDYLTRISYGFYGITDSGIAYLREHGLIAAETPAPEVKDSAHVNLGDVTEIRYFATTSAFWLYVGDERVEIVRCFEKETPPRWTEVNNLIKTWDGENTDFGMKTIFTPPVPEVETSDVSQEAQQVELERVRNMLNAVYAERDVAREDAAGLRKIIAKAVTELTNDKESGILSYPHSNKALNMLSAALNGEARS